MKYTTQQIIQTKEQNNYVFFWGHRPSEDGSIKKSCFSQWWPAAFTAEGNTFLTAEHWMMYKKAEHFNDTEVMALVLKTTDPNEVKKLGRQVKGYDDNLWVNIRYGIVKEGNLKKFSQHDDLKTFLLSTGNTVIVEASPYDKIWGIGMLETDKNAIHPDKWNGLNLLGFALMEVRDELRK